MVLRPRTFAAVLLAVASLSACGSSDESAAPTAAQGPGESQASAGQRFPDIVRAELTRTGETYSVAVTVSSPYDTPQRYADGWRVLAAGTDRVLGEHMLGHDHAGEQPFTRTQSDLRIPADVQRVTVEGRDQANGYGGRTATVEVPR